MMYNLENMCCLCLNEINVSLINLNSRDDDDITPFDKITSCLLGLTNIIERDYDYMICVKCCDFINTIYKFKKDCIFNLNKITSYKKSNEQCSQENVDLKKLQNKEIVVDLDSKNSNSEFNTDDTSNKDNVNSGMKIKDEQFENDDVVSSKKLPKQNQKINERMMSEDLFKNSICIVDDTSKNMIMYKISSIVHLEVAKESEMEDEKKGGKSILEQPACSYIEDDAPKKKVTSNIEEKLDQIAVENVLKTDIGKNDDESQKQKRKKENLIGNDVIKKKHTCDVCNKTFEHQSRLKRHKAIHLDEKLFSCNLCDKSFALQIVLNNHMTMVHVTKAFECDVCKRTFKRKTHLDSHKLIHSNERSHFCSLCEKSFKRKTELVGHERTHTGQIFECDVCQKEFTIKQRLDQHKLTHSSEKPFSCEICKKEFKYKVYLKEHKLSHEGEKPHECDICDKTFLRKSTLNQHKRTHTGEKPYICDVCNNSFWKRSYLNSHKMKFHEN